MPVDNKVNAFRPTRTASLRSSGEARNGSGLLMGNVSKGPDGGVVIGGRTAGRGQSSKTGRSTGSGDSSGPFLSLSDLLLLYTPNLCSLGFETPAVSDN